MSKKIVKNDIYWEETVDTPETEIVEENIYVDESFIKNKALIRMDMNLIQFPIFSKNTKRKVNQIVKYFFNKNRETYITVTPQAGDYIPGETEEKVFIALMQIMKERNMPKKFIVLASELRDKLELNKTTYNNIISKSLSRLASTNYVFKNTLYSSEHQGVIGDKIETSIFNIRTVTLSKKENERYRKLIDDKRVKVIYEIEFSDHFYNNIIQKGYMVYNGDTLLEIESSTARTIYMLIEKLRFDKLYLKVDTIFLIKRIPLKYSKTSLNKTMKTLEKSFNELIRKNLIEDFKFIKESTWEKSEIEISFPENANSDKQGRFYNDRNDFRKILSTVTVSDTVHQMIEEIEVINPKIMETNISIEMINDILNLMPHKAKLLKTMPKTIKESIEKYGYNKVKSVAIYMKSKKVEKIRAYFIKALENDWVEDEIIIEKEPQQIKKQFSLDLNTNMPKYDESLYTEFERFPMDIQNGIESYAYKEYVKECGMDTKIQKLAFKGSRVKYICEFLERYPEILGEYKNKEFQNIQENTLIDLERAKEMIVDTIDMANIANNYEEKEKKELLVHIIKEVTPLFREKKLTLSILEEILKKHTGF